MPQGTLRSGKRIGYRDAAVGEGASGQVHLSTDGRRVVKLYKSAPAGLPEALRLITTHFRQRVAAEPAWASLYAWPEDVVVKPRLGVVMPRVPKDFNQLCWYVLPKALQARPPKERSWWARLLMALRIARAVGRLHREGLCHSDLSHNNVFVCPEDGRVILIDLDGLVVPGLAPPQVMGTPDYIAPEVLEGRAQVSRTTDLHALAVIMYQLLLYRHPLRGPLVRSPDPQVDERLALGSKGIFVDHPSDHRNRPRGVTGKGFWPTAMLGIHVESLFRRAFIDGLSHPDARPTAWEWEQAIARLADRVVTCPSPGCAERYFPSNGASTLVCPWCRKRFVVGSRMPLLWLLRETLRGTKYALDGDWFIPGWPGKELFDWHADPNAVPGPLNDSSPRARIQYVGPRPFLVNLGFPNLFVVNQGAAPPGSRVPLEVNTALQLNPSASGRLVFVQPGLA